MGHDIINGTNLQVKLHKKMKAEVNFLNGCATKNVDQMRLLLKQRRKLPIYSVRNQLLEHLLKNETVIVIGETGSGKTTQIPQFIHEERWDRKGMVGITQPRRVAAITIAKRVAEEMSTDLGDLVGYSVRFEEMTLPRTKLKYVTDGMLMREAISDHLLEQYSWIILDEAHERTVNTDVLFGIVKDAQRHRRKKGGTPLRVVIMSATMDVDHFSQYFGGAPVLFIEGRQYPVEIFYARESQEDYVLACMSTVFQIHKEAPAQHDIIVFLTGKEEIDAAIRTMQHIARDVSMVEYPHLRFFPLYAALPTDQHSDVFRPTPTGERKVVVCTNIAETSITIPGIRYVVDSGRAKIRTYQPGQGLDSLKVQQISQAQAWQRSGRAGRDSPGYCYRSYTLEQFQSFKVNPIPEILRSNLASVFLQLLAIGVQNLLSFEFIDKPTPEAASQALEQLLLLGAITSIVEPVQLTELGHKMALFPLEPRFSKVLLCGSEYGCTEEVLTIVSLLSSESLFVNPSGKTQQAMDVRSKFIAVEGDHITQLKIFREFKAAKENRNWCQNNFLNYGNLQYAAEVRKQLVQVCMRCNVAMKSSNQDFSVVRKCLLTGLFSTVAELQTDGKYLTTDTRQDAYIHPSSVLFSGKPHYILYSELMHTGKVYMNRNSIVDPQWLYDVAPDYFRKKHIRH